MALRHRVIRKIVAEIFEGKLETVGEAKGVRDGLGLIAKERLHFCAILQMALAIIRQESARRIKMGVFADTGKNVKHFAA